MAKGYPAVPPAQAKSAVTHFVQIKAAPQVKPAKVSVVQAPRENNFRHFMPLAPKKP